MQRFGCFGGMLSAITDFYHQYTREPNVSLYADGMVNK